MALAFLILGGLSIRLPHLADPPLEFHPTRQYRAALIARGYVADQLPDLSEAERRAISATGTQSPIEPPIFELAAALAYRVTGREALWMPRLMGVIAWLLGALGVWVVVRLSSGKLSPSPADPEPLRRAGSPAPGPRSPVPIAALSAVALYMFLPYTVPASQAFQPDAPMTALIAMALAASVWRWQTGTRRATVVSVVLTAAAIFVKPMAAFFILPVDFALALVGARDSGLITQNSELITHNSRLLPRVALAALRASLAVIPAAAWYIYVALVAPSVLDERFFPQLLARPAFWTDWFLMLDRVVTWPVLVLAVVGVIVAARPLRWALAASWAGYAAFGMLFTHHIHTHDYYSLPVVVLVAWSIGAGMGRLVETKAADTGGFLPVRTTVALGVVALAMLFAWRNPPYPHDPRSRLTAANYERIGRVVNHSTNALALDGNYALALNYHGRMAASNLPLSIDTAVASLAGRTVSPSVNHVLSGGADYFVATVQAELDGQPDLRALLNERYTRIDSDGSKDRWRYLVYDLKRLRFSVTPDQLSAFVRVGTPEGPAETVALWTPDEARWHVRVSEPGLLAVVPEEGTGPAELRLIPTRAAGEFDKMLEVSIVAEGQDAPAAILKARVRAIPPTANTPPFGHVDTPGDPVVLGGSAMVFQGWALDDLSLKRVWAAYDDSSGSLVALGDAVRGGLRADVAAAHPHASDIYRSAWAFTLDSTRLRAGVRPLTLRFLAEDSDGHRAELGRRSLR